MFGFVLYVSEYTAKGNGSTLFISKVSSVHTNLQVYYINIPAWPLSSFPFVIIRILELYNTDPFSTIRHVCNNDASSIYIVSKSNSFYHSTDSFIH